MNENVPLHSYRTRLKTFEQNFVASKYLGFWARVELFWENAAFFIQYSDVNAANAVNLQAKRR